MKSVFTLLLCLAAFVSGCSDFQVEPKKAAIPYGLLPNLSSGLVEIGLPHKRVKIVQPRVAAQPGVRYKVNSNSQQTVYGVISKSKTEVSSKPGVTPVYSAKQKDISKFNVIAVTDRENPNMPMMTAGKEMKTDPDMRKHYDSTLGFNKKVSSSIVEYISLSSLVKKKYANSLSRAVDRIGSIETVLYVDTSTTVSANLTIPANIHIFVIRDGNISISNSVTLTINGTFDAKLYQVFSGAGDVVFGGSMTYVYPQWWGTTEDGSTNDAAAFQAANDSIEGIGGTIYVPNPSTSYGIGTTVDLSAEVHILGSGFNDLPTFTATEATAVFRYAGAGEWATDPAGNIVGGSIRNVSIDGNYTGTIGIEIDIARFIYIENCFIKHFTDHSIKIGGTTVVTTENQEGANRCSNIFISRCRFRESNADAVSILAGQISAIYISQNTFGDAIDTSGAIEAFDGGCVEITDNVFAMGAKNIINIYISKDYYDTRTASSKLSEGKNFRILNNHFENSAVSILDYIDISPQYQGIRNVEIRGNNFANRNMNINLSPAENCLDSVWIERNHILAGEGCGRGEVIIGEYTTNVYWGHNYYGDMDQDIRDMINCGRLVDSVGGNPPYNRNGIYFHHQQSNTFTVFGDNIDQTLRQSLTIVSGEAGASTHFIAPRDGYVRSVSVHLNDKITAGEFAIRMQVDQNKSQEQEIIDCDSTNTTQIGSTAEYGRTLVYPAWQKTFYEKDAITFIAYEKQNTLAPTTIDIRVTVECVW